MTNFQPIESRGIAGKQGSVKHFGASNCFGVPAPKPGAIPNFAKPGNIKLAFRRFFPKWSKLWSKKFYHIYDELSTKRIEGNCGKTGKCKTFWSVEPFGCSSSQNRRATPGYSVHLSGWAYSPKPSALLTGPHMDMKLRSLTRNGQNFGQGYILYQSRKKGKCWRGNGLLR